MHIYILTRYVYIHSHHVPHILTRIGYDPSNTFSSHTVHIIYMYTYVYIYIFIHAYTFASRTEHLDAHRLRSFEYILITHHTYHTYVHTYIYIYPYIHMYSHHIPNMLTRIGYDPSYTF